MQTSYSPVQYVYREVIAEQIEKGSHGKIFYFDNDDKVEETAGRVCALEDLPGKGMFITLDTGVQIRIDRIITLFGKPGSAFDEYDAYANQCLSCTGGYDMDKLD